jgi:drug/metabolite transporter (DMT)-like permease
MVYVLAVAAALSNALISVLQRMGVEDAKEEDTLKLSLITHALRRGVWLAGFALMVGSFILQALALHFGSLSEVQPILVTELLFLVFILSVWFQYRTGPVEWLGVVLASGGLAGFLFFSSPTPGGETPSNLDWILVGGSCVGAMVIATLLALRGPRWWRAAMFGVAAAVGYAFTASLTKEVTHYVAVDWTTMFLHWQTYGVAVFGVLSVFLTQNAFHAGPIGASQAALVLVDPIVSISIGIALFADNLQTQGVRGPLEAISLLVLIVGGFILSHSSAVALLKGEEGAEGDLLAPRLESRRRARQQAAARRHDPAVHHHEPSPSRSDPSPELTS